MKFIVALSLSIGIFSSSVYAHLSDAEKAQIAHAARICAKPEHNVVHLHSILQSGPCIGDKLTDDLKVKFLQRDSAIQKAISRVYMDVSCPPIDQNDQSVVIKIAKYVICKNLQLSELGAQHANRANYLKKYADEHWNHIVLSLLRSSRNLETSASSIRSGFITNTAVAQQAKHEVSLFIENAIEAEKERRLDLQRAMQVKLMELLKSSPTTAEWPMMKTEADAATRRQYFMQQAREQMNNADLQELTRFANENIKFVSLNIPTAAIRRSLASNNVGQIRQILGLQPPLEQNEASKVFSNVYKKTYSKKYKPQNENSPDYEKGVNLLWRAYREGNRHVIHDFALEMMKITESLAISNETKLKVIIKIDNWRTRANVIMDEIERLRQSGNQ